MISTTPEFLQESYLRPCPALIILAYGPLYRAARSAVVPTIPEHKGSGPNEPVIWMKQTIGHACGLMALLHIAFNLEDSRYVRPGTALDVLRQQAIPLGPTERAQLLMTPAFWKRRNWMWQRVDLRMRLRLGRITNTASWPSCRQMGSSGSWMED